ncbi:MAG: FdtA/QdtA family cupin domain-containing protein [Bacteroidota bacterium]
MLHDRINNKTKHLDFPKILDLRGNLTFIQFPDHIPFQIKRSFWTYDVPGGEIRGGHAYKNQEEIIIALSGSFDVIITSLEGKVDTITLNRSYYGLYLPALTWRHMQNYSTNSLSLHLSSHLYDPKDYLRDFKAYQKYAKNRL